MIFGTDFPVLILVDASNPTPSEWIVDSYYRFNVLDVDEPVQFQPHLKKSIQTIGQNLEMVAGYVADFRLHVPLNTDVNVGKFLKRLLSWTGDGKKIFFLPRPSSLPAFEVNPATLEIGHPSSWYHDTYTLSFTGTEVFTSIPEYPSGIVLDGSFEKEWWNLTGSTVSITNTLSYSGQKSLTFNGTTYVTETARSQFIRVYPVSSYTINISFRYWIKMNTTGYFLYLYVRFFDENFSQLGNAYLVFYENQESTTWQSFSATKTFTTPSDAAYMAFSFEITPSGVEIYIDDVLVNVSPGTVFI